MSPEERSARLAALAARADAALEAGDEWAANALLRERRLVEDGGRDADDLLADGMALIRISAQLHSPDLADP